LLGLALDKQRRIAEQQRSIAEQQLISDRYRKNAEQQKEQRDTALKRAAEIIAQDKEKDPAKVREFLEWAAENGSVEAKTALRSLDDHREPPGPPVEGPVYGCADCPAPTPGGQHTDDKPRESSGKATAKGNKNAGFKPLSTASRATFWRWWGSHLAIEAKVSRASHRATVSARW
jgi:hypothetical protein